MNVLKKYKNDLLLIGGILLCAGLLALVLSGRGSGAYVRIEADGETVGYLPLFADAEKVYNGKDGGENTVVISNGKARVLHASCPDKLCEHQGEKSKIGDTIVCLPNRFVVTVVGREEAEAYLETLKEQAGAALKGGGEALGETEPEGSPEIFAGAALKGGVK